MRRLTGRLMKAVQDALALLLPFRCAACGRLAAAASMDAAMAAADRNGADTARTPLMRLLCPACRDTVLPVTTPLCSHCGRPFPETTGDDHPCGDCLGGDFGLEKMRAAAVYQGALVSLVRQLKYHQAVHLADAMRPWLLAVYQRHWPGSTVDLVVPVPLHRRRLRQRGYNQSWLLARAVFGKSGAAPAPRLRDDVLVRVRDTPSQTGLTRDQRRRNMLGAFTVPMRPAVTDRHVLVVDDVVTTGETMAACAGVLLSAGARRVDALSMARTPRRHE